MDWKILYFYWLRLKYSSCPTTNFWDFRNSKRGLQGHIPCILLCVLGNVIISSKTNRQNVRSIIETFCKTSNGRTGKFVFFTFLVSLFFYYFTANPNVRKFELALVANQVELAFKKLLSWFRIRILIVRFNFFFFFCYLKIRKLNNYYFIF